MNWMAIVIHKTFKIYSNNANLQSILLTHIRVIISLPSTPYNEWYRNAKDVKFWY